MSWIYRWTVIVPWINIMGNRVSRPGSLRLQSNSIVRDATPNGGVSGWVSLAAHLMATSIPDVIQPGALRWFTKTQGPVVKVLPVSRQRPIRHLALRVRVVSCDSLLDDWSVESVFSMITL
ncbi:uncharacterized protein TNCV_851981 [Trichonephila clavipes]|nr:uncharacterized protein TNCV_851981 [Trichonephila clavipes]